MNHLFWVPIGFHSKRSSICQAYICNQRFLGCPGFVCSVFVFLFLYFCIWMNVTQLAGHNQRRLLYLGSDSPSPSPLCQSPPRIFKLFSVFMGPKSDHCLTLSVTHSLIHSLTIKCCWDLTDVTLACEDARVATDHFMGRSSLLWQNLAAMMPGQYQSHLSGMELCICSNSQTIVFSAICRDTLSLSFGVERNHMKRRSVNLLI